MVQENDLVQSVASFYEVSSGEITIDGRNIQKMTLASLRKQIGIVQQDVFYSLEHYEKILLMGI